MLYLGSFSCFLIYPGSKKIQLSLAVFESPGFVESLGGDQLLLPGSAISSLISHEAIFDFCISEG